jgi:hypothetical protein
MPKEFAGFLDDKKVYEEAGNAVKLIVDKFGKGKLFEFLEKQSNISEISELNKAFEDAFDAKLDYTYFNKLIPQA